MAGRPCRCDAKDDWAGLCAEAAAGGLSALAAAPDGELVRDPALRRLLRETAREAAAAARSAGLRVCGDPAAIAGKRCRTSPDRRHPWQRALAAGRASGADEILGGLLAAARRAGIPVPRLSLIAAALKRLDRKR